VDNEREDAMWKNSLESNWEVWVCGLIVE
jgi:hypothetical protein